jgi:hypothetical protein
MDTATDLTLIVDGLYELFERRSEILQGICAISPGQVRRAPDRAGSFVSSARFLCGVEIDVSSNCPQQHVQSPPLKPKAPESALHR